MVGAILLISAVRLVWTAKQEAPAETKPAPLVPAIICGAAIGLLSGLTGTGGGIFLSPLLLFWGWAETRQSAGVSAAFILLNSIAGLAGNFASVRGLPMMLPVLVIAAVTGGVLGTELGSRKLPPKMLLYLLAAVLVVAGLKLLFVR